MTVDKLDCNKILITLCLKDMADFALNFDTLGFDDCHSRRILMRILRLACVKSGIEMNDKSVLVEALPSDDGCYILLTVNEKHRRTYKLKGTKESVCYLLGNSSNFLDTVEKLYSQNVVCNRNAAYLLKGEYYLIFDYPSVPKKLQRVLNEYAQKCGGKVCAARIKENGKQLCRQNAISVIGQFL